LLGWAALRLLVLLLVPPAPTRYKPKVLGDITAHRLAKHNGLDPSWSTLIAIKKVVYDVTECALFSPLGPLSNLAGHECSLALCSVKAALPDVLRRRGDPSNADGVDATAVRAEDIDREAGEGLGEEARARLEAWRTALVESGFEVVGAVVEPRTVTVQQLREMNGEDDRPVWVCIRGRVFDASAGRRFYGPGGPYARFAGRRVGRALAKFSEEMDDCTDDLDGLSRIQLDGLADWEARFAEKYDLVGPIEEGAPLRV